MTVNNAVFVTVIVEVVAPVLHTNGPVKLLAVKTELPQLSTTVTVGAAKVGNGLEVVLPEGLAHPFTV